MASDPYAGMNQFIAGRLKAVKLTKKGVQEGAEIFTAALKKNVPYRAQDHSKYGHLRDQIQAKISKDGVDTIWGDAFWYLFLDKGTSPSKKRGAHGGKSYGMAARNITRKTWAQTERKVFEAMKKYMK